MLSLSCVLSPVDRHRPVADGSVAAKDISLAVTTMPVQDLFDHQLKTHEFDVSETPIATYLRMRASGDERMMGIPVFPSRFFRHSCLFVNADAGISGPADLAGRRLGVAVFDMAAAVWMRGIFHDDYGLDPRSVTYVTGGMDEPRSGDAHPQVYPEGIKIVQLGSSTCLSDALANGEIDALVTARAPRTFFSHPKKVKRLFADCRAVERDYFTRTGIFPMMHCLTVRKSVYDANPWVAQSLFAAFEAAKERARAAIVDTSALSTMLPWLAHELEETEAFFKGDPWVNGLDANRHALGTIQRYMIHEGLLSGPVNLDAIFDGG